jgi:ABC-type Fe3+ transport system substrate-binding protein
VKRFVLTIALCLFCGLQSVRAADGDLVIITPHNTRIQFEFEKGFERHIGRDINIRWIKQGTSQLVQLLAAKDKAGAGKTFEMDIFFGGGPADHRLAASRGYLEKAILSNGALAGIPEEVAGMRNFDPDRLWYCSALSTFGILVNKQAAATQKITPPASWKDLADPSMYGWVVIADARKSASVQVCYEAILQQYGWEEGWGILMRIAANSRLIADSSSAVPNEVGTGNALAGPCVDFYGRARVAQAGADVLAFVEPHGGTAITPDPISMLRRPPHKALAEQFMNYTLSEAGQRLWILDAGAPGGPEQNALYRTPVRRDICAEGARLGAISDPYEQAEKGAFLHFDGALQRQRVELLAELMGAAMVDIHDEMKGSWKAIIDGGMKENVLKDWSKPPFPETKTAEMAAALEKGGRDAKKLTRQWTTDFRNRYRKAEADAKK